MLRYKALLFFLCAAAASTAVLCPNSPAQNQSASLSPKLRALLEQKRDTLKARVEIMESGVKSGTRLPDALFAASDDLIEAELALAMDQAQRIKVLEKRLTNAKEYESLVLERQRIGASGTKETDALMATSARLDAEIALVRAQESQN